MYDEILILGVLAALVFTEITGLSPAGLIVPAYMALNLSSPFRMLATLLVALAAFGIARLLSRFLILYGRRRFAVMVFLSFGLSWLLGLFPALPYHQGVIGVLIPGIMANEFEKQGFLKSLLSLLIVTGILALLMLLLGMPVFSFV